MNYNLTNTSFVKTLTDSFMENCYLDFFQESWNSSFFTQQHPDKYTLTIEVPGYDSSDLEVEITSDQFLILRGVANTVGKTFEKSFLLPKNINDQAITASYHAGVITFNIPKRTKNEALIRKIPIQLNHSNQLV